MLPQFLLPETVARQDGAGAEINVEISGSDTVLLLTLGITRVLEAECLDVSIWGSADGEHWEELASFPHKCYCGNYSLALDLSHRPQIRYLRTQWKMERWGSAEVRPLFGFHVFAEEMQVQHAGAA
jgi:hypothetical protein